MADRTVRAIFEARVSGAQKGMRDLSTDVDKTGKKVEGLDRNLTALDKKKVKPQIDLDIAKAEREVADLKAEIARLDALEATPEVLLDFARAQAQLGAVEADLKKLNGRKAEMIVTVTADTDDVESKLYALGDVGEGAGSDIGKNLKQGLAGAVTAAGVAVVLDDALEDAAQTSTSGKKAGAAAGAGIGAGILDALRSIPIAGAVVGIGAAIGTGLLVGIKRGLDIEAERDFFSAQTGLDEETSARFGRAAGEAYANAWGDSVQGNLDTARIALKGGLIDQNATDAEIENVIAKLSGITDLFDYDVTSAVRAVGNLMKTGLVKDANQAFDLITAGSQKVVSDDLLDTLNEYSNQFVKLGLTADQAFGLIVQGAEAGARDTDNVADTLKEMGLRIRAGTDPAVKALKDLGLNAGSIIEAFQDGGPRAAAAMEEVFDALRVMEEKGGNVQSVITNLFGGPGEDLGAALFALSVDDAAEALGGLEGAAGSADEALATMSDNTATKMEEAKRNIEVAVDGIQGALAEAFGDEIGGAADWIRENREAILQFFIDAINGTIDLAAGFTEFGATSLDIIGDIATAFADLINVLPDWLLPQGAEDGAAGLREFGKAAKDSADDIRNNIPTALDDVRNRVNTWAAPELMKARIHDATVAMTNDFKTFIETAGEDELDVTINGDTVNAEEALATLVDNINEEDGTVTINGDDVPAKDALDYILGLIAAGEEDVTVGADTDPADSKLQTFKGKVSISEASMSINADDAAAKKKLAALTGKDYYATVRVNIVSNRISDGLTGGQHDGGWITGGLHAGGKVPGRDPGYDNVLWPLYSGGKTLMQPLAGGEYVVNSKDSAYWGPMLEWMNNGGRPTTHTETTNAPVYIGTVSGPDLDDVLRKAEQTARERRVARGRR